MNAGESGFLNCQWSKDWGGEGKQGTFVKRQYFQIVVLPFTLLLRSVPSVGTSDLGEVNEGQESLIVSQSEDWGARYE